MASHAQGPQASFGAMEAPAQRLALLNALVEAADEAPTIEEALRLSLACLCRQAGWLAARLQFVDSAPLLAGRTYWHLESTGEVTRLRAVARLRRVPVPTEGPSFRRLDGQEAEACGARAVLTVPLQLSSRPLAALELYTARPEEPGQPLEELIAFACSELARILARKPADDALRRSEREYRALFEQAQDCILVVDAEGHTVLDANERAARLFGRGRLRLLGASLEELLAPDDHARLRRGLAAGDERFEVGHLRPDGTVAALEVSAGPVDHRGRQALWMSLRDVSSARRVVAALQASEERYRLLFDQSPFPMWVVDEQRGTFLAVNQAAVVRYGYSREQLGGMTEAQLAAPGDALVALSPPPPGLQGAGEALSPPAPRPAPLRHRTAGGELIDVETTRHSLTFDGQAASLVVVSDVTERRRAEERLWHAAFFDGLTNLPNRALFNERLGQAHARAGGRSAVGFAVLFLDLDRFKVINDCLGHRAGDELLVQIARRLERIRRAGDTVARLGGDEFAMLLEGVTHAQEAIHAAERVQRELRRPFQLGAGSQKQEVFSSASIGIALGAVGRSPEELLRDADTAMYRAKSRGAAQHALFDIGMHSRAVAVLRLEQDLRRALDKGELQVVYQPQVKLPAGRIVGFEAFARWHHKDLGPIPPSEFIPLAEEAGLVGQLDRQVLAEACATLRELQRAWPRKPPLVLSVNLSGRELLKEDLVPEVERVVRESGLDPGVLSLEITEAVLVDNEEQAHRSIDGLRKLGIRVCLDDFGTGCSSLGSLHRLPLDGLKVHGSFVDTMVADQHNLRVVESLVLLGHNLGLEVIAEGVERADQVRELSRMGCDGAQGFLFGSPLDRTAAAAALTAETLLPPPTRILS